MKKSRIKLQYLIIGVALLAFVLTSIVSIWSGYKLSKDSLAKTAQETNRVYAQKLANTANNYLEEQLKLLSANTSDIVGNIENQNYLEEKSDLIRNQTSAFNSIAIVNSKAIVLATSPQTLDIIGVKLTSAAMKEAIEKEKVMISQPYESISGRLIVFISVPLFSKENKYLGLIGGTIYLKEKNVLSDLLGEHPYSDGSTVSVVDEDGTVIYDENEDHIGKNMNDNALVKIALEKQETGVAIGENSEDVNAFAGFSHIKEAGWMVISQRPVAATEEPASDMVKQMIQIALPLLLLSIIVIMIASYKIAKPLQRLAELTESSKSQNENANLQSVPAWYYEAIQLKESLILSLGFLHNQVHDLTDQSQRDGLTGLLNRRTMDLVIKKFEEDNEGCAIILFDVDHFKRVNDTFGHQQGDEVLKYIAQSVTTQIRPTDLCFRYGGEEFIILLPQTTGEFAFELIETIRINFANTKSPTGEVITISAGVAEFPRDAQTVNEVITVVDEALYEAKSSGRNQTKIGKR